MAKFDVFRTREGALLLDCQADLLENLATRFVVPLLPEDASPKPLTRLNPVFVVQDQRHVMATQFAASILVRDLGEKVSSLITEEDRISLALDMLIVGF